MKKIGIFLNRDRDPQLESARHAAAELLRRGASVFFDLSYKAELSDTGAEFTAHCDMLEKSGYRQYEISNFARSGFESRHNLKYWDLTEYVGFGLGSSSFFEGARYQNPEVMADYLDFADNFTPFWNGEKQSENDLNSEFMFLGLRLQKGVSDLDFKEKFGKSFFEIFSKEIAENVEKGLLIKENDRIYLSSKGFDLANSVMSDFLLED